MPRLIINHAVDCHICIIVVVNSLDDIGSLPVALGSPLAFPGKLLYWRMHPQPHRQCQVQCEMPGEALVVKLRPTMSAVIV